MIGLSRTAFVAATHIPATLAVLGLALGSLGLPREARAESARDRATPARVLATPGQLERERQTLEILASDAMKRATKELVRIYHADERGKTKSGKATARRAAESTAAAAVHGILGEDTARPVVFWGANAPHRWFGMSLPRAGYGIENPDNVYRSVHLDGASRYAIRGRMPKSGPVEQHYVVMDQVPGSSKSMPVEGAQFLATLRSDALVLDTEGRFTITIDADPANGRPNHMQIPSEGHFPMHVRDLFTDWSSEDPIPLEIERLSGPAPKPAPSLAELSERAAKRLLQMGPFWLEYNNRFLYTLPPNTIDAPRVRPGGRGASASGHFALAPNEALVVTLDPKGAKSLGFQIADPWGVAYEYVDRTSSLNAQQSIANADGTYTFVVAAKDPGVHNWIDPDGQSAGILVLRWQVLPENADLAQAIRSVRVVRTSELASALPANTRFVSKAERKQQQAERAAAYARRLGQ